MLLNYLKPFFTLIISCYFSVSLYSQNQERIELLHKEFYQILLTDFNKATKIAKEAVLDSEKINDKNVFLISLKNLSEVLYLKRENDSAYTYNKKAISLALELNNNKQLAKLHNLLGSIERRKNNYTASLKYYEKALILANKNSKEEIPKIKNNLARLYWATDERQNAKNILQEVLEIKDVHKNDIADAYNILGVISFEKNKDSSLVYYKKAYFLAAKSNYYLKSIISSNLGYVSLNLKDNKKALEYLKESEQLSETLGDKSSLHHINISLGIYYEHQGDFNNAIKKYKKAIEEYGSFVDDFQKSKAYLTASGVFYHAKKYKEAYLYLDTFLELNEKILGLEKKKEFEKIRTEYEVESKENKIILLEKETQIANANRKILLFAGSLVVFILILALLFYRHRIKVQKKLQDQKNKLFKSEKERLLKKQEIKKIQGYLDGQEKEKNRIAKELHDGIAGELAGVKHLLYAIDKNNNQVNKVANTISLIAKNVRLLSHNLSTTYITNNSLIHLLADLKNSYESTNTFKITINSYPDNCFNIVKEAYKHHLYRITQELLNNIEKYANAKEITISFVKQKEYLSFIIEDNGVGFSDEKEDVLGIGLNNVKSRVISMNGKINIDSKVNLGTTISIEIPN
jgi:two-component system NarL family sensor kinase